MRTRSILTVLIVVTVSRIRADSCDDGIPAYFDCLAADLQNSTSGRQLDQELDDAVLQSGVQCFDDGSGKSSQNCVLEKKDLNVDAFGREGPLRACVVCQEIAKYLQGMYFQSTDKERLCLRQHFYSAVRVELNPCIQNRLSDEDFKLPAFPDFDKNAFTNNDIVLSILNHFILLNTRLDVCSLLNADRAKNSKNCLASIDEAKLYRLHCQTTKLCQSVSIPNTCNTRFGQVQDAVCGCLSNRRQEFLDKLNDVRSAIFNTTNAKDCAQKIIQALGTWKEKLEVALNACSTKPGVNMQQMIELGCVQIQSMGDASRRNLQSGIRFLRQFMDALYERVARFCHKCV